MAEVTCCEAHKLGPLEKAEAEVWSDYRKAVQERKYQERFGTVSKAEAWKVKARAILLRHDQIMKRIFFSYRRGLYNTAREHSPDWTGYLRKGTLALERAEERVLVTIPDEEMPHKVRELGEDDIIRTIEEVVSVARAVTATDPEPGLEAQR